MTRSLRVEMLRWLAFGALLLAAASIREGPASAVDQAIIWLPTGVAIAGLCLLGLRAWWVIAAVTLVQRLLIGYDWTVAIPAAAGSTVEALLGVLVLRRLGFRQSLGRMRDVGALFAAAAIAPLGSILFSWVGRSFFWDDPNMPFYSGWDGWWRMNGLGVLAVVPIALAWLPISRRELTPRLLSGVTVALIGLSALLFGLSAALPADATGVMWLNLVLTSVVLYAAGRFGMRGATLASALSALFVAIATSWGHGPFLGLPRVQRHVTIQLFELTLLALPTAFAALMAERRAALDRDRRSGELLASINRNVKDGLFRAGADLRLRYANLALARMLGHDSPEDVLGLSLGDALADPGRRSELLALGHEQGQLLNEEVRFLRGDGSSFWGLVSGTVVRDAGGGISHYDGAIVDITARKALEEQFRQAQKMEAVGKLAGGIAHDFNNLLTVIVGYAEAIRTASDGRERVRAQAGEVLDAATRAAGLTRQLLAYSRQQMLLPQVLELGDVVDRMGGMLRRLIPEDIRLVVERPSGPCWVRVDPSQIEQVLLNLVVNSRDAIDGGGTLTISTALEEIDQASARAHADLVAGPCVMLRVRDTGVGMAPEVLARAFDPFFTTKGPGGGTGLGLATVYGIVKQSGGSTWLESVPGEGTTACVAMPRWSTPPIALEAPTPAVQERRQGTVLVVEDEPAVRELICDSLRSRGYQVIEAGNGARGLEAALQRDGALDLVVTDVVMPVMGGRELAARLVSQRPGTRFLFVSGYPDDARAPHDLAGADGNFLPKPFTPRELLERVDRILQSGTGLT